MLGGLQCTLSAALIGRLSYLQTVNAETYKTLAENNRINLQLLVPKRGLILDRFGNTLAENKTNYRLMLERRALENTAQKRRIFAVLSELLSWPAPPEDVLERQRRRTPHSQSIMLKEYLSWDEVSLVEFHAPKLPGVSVETGSLRHYPLESYASHLVGYVGTPSPEEAEGNRLLNMPGVKIGKSGLEKREEARLRGEAGLRYMEVNALGQYLDEVKRRDSVPGDNVRCTISAELQRYASKRLGEESGSVVVMDVTNGDVLALCSVPSFDPNKFSRGITHRYWDELMENKKTPMMNKAIGGQYPPGSTFKMIVGLAALKQEVITPETRFYCPGHYDVGNHRFHCWKLSGHGWMNYNDAIEQSCDTFFYNIAHELGIDAIGEVSRAFGLGQSYDLNIVGEQSGLIPDPDWKRRSYDQSWQVGDTVNASIGQGYVLVTPLQLAIMAARLATGKAVSPRLTIGDDVPTFANMELSVHWLQQTQQAMYAVTSSEHGTARSAQIEVPAFEMAGKTGTSQVRRITLRGQDQSTLPWEQRHHGLFVAFAPYDKPRYAASVVIEHGGSSSVASPIARDVLRKTQELFKGFNNE